MVRVSIEKVQQHVFLLDIVSIPVYFVLYTQLAYIAQYFYFVFIDREQRICADRIYRPKIGGYFCPPFSGKV